MRVDTTSYAHHAGFAFVSSLKKALRFFMVREEEQTDASQEAPAFHVGHMTDGSSSPQESIAEDEQEDVEVSEGDEQQALSEQSPQPAMLLQQNPSPTSAHSPRKQSIPRQIGLIAALVALLVVAGAVLLPALFSAQPELTSTAQPATQGATSVGQVAFTSSGQLDPASSTGLNDTITVSLHNLSTPAAGQSYYAWLMPDATDDNTRPLLLGRLSITDGKAQLTYVPPDHENLLAVYSGFEVAEQQSDPMPTTPPLDSKLWRYVGSIPNTPTPGDERHYSLLSHMRHLLAKDPTLQQIGLQGGLDIWLYRNAEKILEWSSAARDSWQGGQQTDLMHRHMIRVLDYLDGAAYVESTGDVPAGSPLLVDPQAGRLGLLEVNQTQLLPAYLIHVDTHLQGVVHAPGHTETQRQLALKIDSALKQVTSLMQKIHQDAVKLVKMNAAQLKSSAALALLNDMVTNATSAYVGQFDPTIGGNTNGVVWIHNELQGLATMSVTVISVNTQ